jgi:hypothetical protein
MSSYDRSWNGIGRGDLVTLPPGADGGNRVGVVMAWYDSNVYEHASAEVMVEGRTEMWDLKDLKSIPESIDAD